MVVADYQSQQKESDVRIAAGRFFNFVIIEPTRQNIVCVWRSVHQILSFNWNWTTE